MNLSELKPGQRGIIQSFTDLELSIKLMEMGCLPGSEIIFERVAPMGDPIAITVAGYQLSLRRQEASTILIESRD